MLDFLKQRIRFMVISCYLFYWSKQVQFILFIYLFKNSTQ